MGREKDRVWLNYVVDYTGKDWVFFTKIIIAADEERYTISYGYGDVVRNVGWGKVWEYVNEPTEKKDRDILKAIAESNETIIRFQGDNYSHDFTVSAGDKKAIKDALLAYDAFN